MGKCRISGRDWQGCAKRAVAALWECGPEYLKLLKKISIIKKRKLKIHL